MVQIRSYEQGGRRMLFLLPPATMKGVAITPSHHPIMTVTLAAIAQREGATVGVLDAALLGLRPEKCATLIAGWHPDWVGIVPCEYRRELPLQSALAVVESLRKRSNTPL